MKSNAQAKITGTRSAGQAAKKAQTLNRELDRLIAQFGPAYPGLANVLNGARKLLYAPSPGLGSKDNAVMLKRRTT